MGSQIEGNIVFLFVISEILMITLYLILKKFPEGFRLPGYLKCCTAHNIYNMLFNESIPAAFVASWFDS